MTNRKLIATAVVALAALLLAGCPNLRVGQVRLAAPPKGGKFTVQADVEARYEGNDPREISGRAVVAVWLPERWKAAAIRIRPPGGTPPETMIAVPEFAPDFPPTFPYQPGAWWPFVTGDLEITAEETTVFPVEIDVEGPARAGKVVLGVALGAIADCELNRKVGWEYEIDLPTEIAVDLRKGTVAVRENPPPVDTQLPGCVKKPEPDAGLEEDAGTAADGGPAPEAGIKAGQELPTYDCDCPECPPPVERGPRGCACDGPGAPSSAPGLVRLLIGLSS